MLRADLRLGFNLTGVGLGVGTFGGVHSALLSGDAAGLFSNPAMLGTLTHRQLIFGSRISLANGSLGIGRRSILTESMIRRETDRLLSDLEFPANSEPVYTRDNTVTVGQPGQFVSLSIAWPVNRYLTAAFGYHQPFVLDLGFRATGSEIQLDGRRESGTQSIAIDVLAGLSIDSSIRLEMNQLSFGIGGFLEEYYAGSVWWGVSAHSYQVSSVFDWSLVADAMIILSGSEQFFFNDDRDPNIDFDAGESNRLRWLAHGNFRGSGWGLRLGTMFRSFEEGFGASLIVNLVPTIDLYDRFAFAESYLPVFVDLSGSLDAEAGERTLLDIEKLILAKPTLTTRTRDAMGSEMSVHLPSSYTLGVDWRFGRNILAVNVIRYVGEFSLAGEYGLSAGKLKTYRIGKRPSYGFRVGLDIGGSGRNSAPGWWTTPLRIITLDIDGLLFQSMGSWTKYRSAHYRFGAGVLLGRSVVAGLDAGVEDDVDALLSGALPMSLSVGRTYQLFGGVDVGVMVYSLPDLLFRFSVGINLD